MRNAQGSVAAYNSWELSFQRVIASEEAVREKKRRRKEKRRETGETGERGGLGVKRVKKRSISEIVSEVQYEGGRLFQNGATWRILITKIYVQA